MCLDQNTLFSQMFTCLQCLHDVYNVYNVYKPLSMDNKIILFTNIKGGVGKTTLCSLFATYAAEQGIPVAVLDVDIQQSLFRHRARDLQENNGKKSLPWQIKSVSTSDDEGVETLMEKLEKIPGWIIIDCPGNINDHALKYIFQAADVAIIPFGYDEDTLDATLLFCKIFRKVSQAKFFFIPNNIIISDERREAIKVERDNAIRILGNLGKITARIKHGVAVKSYSTIDPLDYWQEKAVENAFLPIIQEIK